MNPYRFISKYLKPHRLRIFFAFMFCLLSSLMATVRPKIIGEVIDSIAEPISNGELTYEAVAGTLLVLLFGYFAVTVFKNICYYLLRYLSEITSQKTILAIREDMYSHLDRLDFGFFATHRTGDIMTKMTSDIECVRHFVAYTIIIFAENIFIFCGSIIIMLTISPILTAAVLVVTPVIFLLTRHMSRSIRPRFHGVREAFSALNTFVQENIGGNRVVKAFASEQQEIEKFKKRNDGYKKANMAVAKVQSAHIPALDFFCLAMNVILIVVGGLLAADGQISIGEIVTMNGLLGIFITPLRTTSWLMSEAERFYASAERIEEFLLSEPAIKTAPEAVKPERLKGKVEFSNVCFRYDDEVVLDNISFVANPGETIAVVGPTGSGKSTLANLISRFYDVTDGNIYIDDIDIKKINLKRLRAGIATAMQDIFLFSDTIESNIAYGNPDVSHKEIERAAAMADAHNFIRNMPDGYSTVVGERGVGLSGGQKQRISLARALLKKPAILILDDTTSAVDTETEHYIQESLKECAGETTTFIIAHRISSVMNADKILVLKEGRIIERGTHEELIAIKDSYYRGVYENQTGNFNSKEEVTGNGSEK